MGIFDGLKLDDEEQGAGGGGIFAGLDLPPAAPEIEFDLGPDKPLKPVQISATPEKRGDDRAKKAAAETPVHARVANVAANIFEGVDVALQETPAVGHLYSGAKTTVQAAGAGVGALFGGAVDPEAWTQRYDANKAALEERYGRELTFAELVQAAPGMGDVFEQAVGEAESLPGQVLQKAAVLGMNIISDPTILITGSGKVAKELARYAATGKTAVEGVKAIPRATAATMAVKQGFGSSAAGALYGPQILEGVLRGVETGEYGDALGAALVGGLVAHGIKKEFEQKFGRPATEQEVAGELERLHAQALAEGRAPDVWAGAPPPGHELAWQDETPAPFKTPAEVRTDMMMLEGQPSVERRGWAEALPATEVGPVKPVESHYEQAKKAEAGAKARWDDVLELAKQEQAADELAPAQAEDLALGDLDFTEGVTPIEEALVRERRAGDGGDRRAAAFAVAQERRMEQRRGAHAKLVASETGLPEDSPAVQRIVKREIDDRIDPHTGLWGARAWDEEIDQHVGGVSVSDMDGMNWINNVAARGQHDLGDVFLREQGRAILEAIEEYNERNPSTPAKGFRPFERGDEVGVLAVDAATADKIHQRGFELYNRRKIRLEFSDGTSAEYTGGTFTHAAAEGKGRDAYKQADAAREATKLRYIAEGRRAPRGQPALREVGGPPELRAGEGAEAELRPPGPEGLPGEPPPGSEGDEGLDRVGPPPEAPTTPPVHSRHHVGYAGKYEYFVRVVEGQDKPQVYRARKNSPIDEQTGQRDGAEWVGPADKDTQKRILAEARADAAELDEAVAAAPVEIPRLPRDLHMAAPRYQDSTPYFESDLDKALYILAQNKLSRSDGKYLQWAARVMGVDPSRSEVQLRELGQQVRAAVGKAKRRREPIPGAPGMSAIVRDVPRVVDPGALRTQGEMRAPKASMASGSRQGRVAAEVVDQVREERSRERAELYGRGEPAPAEPPSAPPRDPGAPPEAPPPGGEPPPEAGGPPSAPIPYPKYARPSSINLWQRIDHGEDALDLFVETAEQFGGLVEEAKRGTMTLAQIKQLATNLGSSEEAVERALSKRVGTALNAEKLWAINEGLKETARATVEHARAFAATPALERSPQMEADLLAQLARHTAVFASVSGANSEAGRALGVLNRIRKSADNAQALQEVIDTYGRSTKDAKQTLGVIAELLAKIPADDVRALGKFVREVSKPTFTSKVYEYWINAILSGPPTHVSNAISGVLGSLLYPAELAMGAGFDAARYSVDHLLRGEAAAPRTIFFREAAEAGKQLLGALDAPLKVAETLGFAKRKITEEDVPAVAFNRGLREALDVAMQAWRTESSVIGDTSRVREMQPRGGAIEGQLGRTVRSPTRLLQATDQFFQALLYRMSLNAQAMNQALREGHSTRLDIADRMAHLLQNPDQITKDKAVAEAAYRTFNAEPGKAGQALLRLRRDIPVMRWVVPFLTTPINIVKFGTERTPGVTAYTLGKAITEYGQGKITARDLGEEGARFMTSTAALLGVAYLAANGQISGAGPKDPAERRTLEATGWRPYSVKIGEDWYGYSRIEPLGLTLRMTADYIEAWQRGDKSAEERAPQLIHAATRNLLDLPMISGLSGLFKVMMDYERYGTGWATRTASSLLPALLGYGKRAADPERRLPKTFMEGVAQKLPGAGKLAELAGGEDPTAFARALDIYGRAELLEDTWWERFASPLRRSQVRSDQVTPHLIRLGINLGSPSKKLEDWIDPQTRKPLPQPQGRDAEVLAQARGIARYALASVVVTQQDFRLAPEDVQREVLRRYLEKGSMVVTRRAKGLLRQGQRLTLQDLVGELLEKGPPAL